MLDIIAFLDSMKSQYLGQKSAIARFAFGKALSNLSIKIIRTPNLLTKMANF